MADNAAYYGKTSPFEIQERSRSMSESRTQTVTLVGKLDELGRLNVSTGQLAPDAVTGGFGGMNGSLHVLNSTLRRTDGEFGSLELTIVETGDVASPYHQTATLDFQPVELPLMNHPRMREWSTQEQIHLWEITDENLRWKWRKNEKPTPRYALPSAGQEARLKDMDDEWAVEYAFARLYGVDKYTVYFPVVEIQSRYLKMKGVDVDAQTHEVSGTFNAERIGELGTFCTPPFSVAGFEKGLWFKTVDRFSQDANGGWTRVEQWTYTNDYRSQWIYKDRIGYEVVGAPS